MSKAAYCQSRTAVKSKNLRVAGSIFDLAYLFGMSKLLIVFYCFLEILEIREIAYNLISQNLTIHVLA